MIDLKQTNWTESEILEVEKKLDELVKEAENAAELIRQTYLFRINEVIIQIWKEGNNTEQLSHTGVWSACYEGQRWCVECTGEEIFYYLMSEYLVKEKLIDDAGHKYYANICKYLREFLERTKQKAK